MELKVTSQDAEVGFAVLSATEGIEIEHDTTEMILVQLVFSAS